MSAISQSETSDTAASPSFLQKHWQKLFALLFWATLLGLYLWYTRSNDLSFGESITAVADLLTDSAVGPLLYILIYTLRPLLFFPATVLTVLGGFLFGAVSGILYVVIGANLSALLAYGVGAIFGKDVLTASDEGEGLLQRYAQRIRRNSFEAVLLMRLIFLPYDLVNYLSGFLRINWKAFLLATIIGSIPGTISFVLLGTSFGTLDELLAGDFQLNPLALGASVVLILASLALSRVLKRREPQEENETADTDVMRNDKDNPSA